MRLAQHGIEALLGLRVPSLVGYDDELWVVEMGIVEPPYLLDFGKAHLDRPADFSPEVMTDWEEKGRELFGAGWPLVRRVLARLKGMGIYYYDVSPGNIRLDE